MASNVGSYYAELSYLYEQMGLSEEWFSQMKYTRAMCKNRGEVYNEGGAKAFWRKRLEGNESRSSYSRAEILARLGKNDEAIDDLNKVYELRDHQMAQLKVNPVFDPLRTDPRFQELLRRMKLIN